MENSQEETKSSEDNVENTPNAKKVRLFSAEEFRKQLTAPEKLTALKDFAIAIKENASQDCVYEYLEKGGNCLELLQLLETDPEVPPTLILDIVYNILLRIHAAFPQCRSAALEACRYLLNSHISTINKMLGTKTSAVDRRTALKLLTTIVTLSATLAKDVLLQVNFNPDNIELLVKKSTIKDSVRTAFVQFLVAFLVEGQYPTIAVLLEKRGLLTSVFPGLKFDNPQLVCVFLVALKSYVLENPFVSKTVKMKTFNTKTVKSIVDLYNWKGPQGLLNASTDINWAEKRKVSGCVHDFLLVLCTSHRHGVIFRDRSLGLVGTQRNALVVTVLKDLHHWWEHSYASELVVKVCAACPDVTRTVWGGLREALERRPTEQWARAVKFARALLGELGPSCVEYCARDLGVHQMAQGVQFLVAPSAIVKQLVAEDDKYESHAVKRYVVVLLRDMLVAVGSYLESYGNWGTESNYRTLRRLLEEHIARYFPTPSHLLSNWDGVGMEVGWEIPPQGFEPYEILDHLGVVFEVLELYKKLCPTLLETLDVDVERLFSKVLEMNGKSSFIKAVRLFLAINPSIFLPTSNLFDFTLHTILSIYHETRDSETQTTAKDFLENTSVFEGCRLETLIWIDGVLASETFHAHLGRFVCTALKTTYTNSNLYLDFIFKCRSHAENGRAHASLRQLLENSEHFEQRQGHDTCLSIRDTNLSPMLLGCLDVLKVVTARKSVRLYVQFALHNLLYLQTDLRAFASVVASDEYADVVDGEFLNYVACWGDSDSKLMPVALEGRHGFLTQFTAAFLRSEMQAFEYVAELYPRQKLYELKAGLFYYTNLLRTGKIAPLHAHNWSVCWKFVAQTYDCLEIILGHPVLLQYFTPVRSKKLLANDLCTDFVVEFVKFCREKSLQTQLEPYLRAYRAKITGALLKLLNSQKHNKHNKYERLVELVDVFELEHSQCVDVLKAATAVQLEALLPDNGTTPVVYSVLVHTLKKFLHLCTETNTYRPLETAVVDALGGGLAFLNSHDANAALLALEFREYLRLFPENVADVDAKVFESVVARNEYCINNVKLAAFLLERKKCPKAYIKAVEVNLDKVCAKKGIILPLLEVLVQHCGAREDVFEAVYRKFKTRVKRALSKPQKAGQHLECHYKSVGVLLEKFFPAENYNTYLDKVHKFETSEPFHCHLLAIIYRKPDSLTDENLFNSILTFVHVHLNLFKKKTKTADDWQKLQKISGIFNELLKDIEPRATVQKTSAIASNAAFQLFCKFSLKFGLSDGQSSLLESLVLLARIVDFGEDNAAGFLEMIVSHSEFLEVVLGEDGECKTELLRLFLVLVQKWPVVMDRSHVPMLLAAYRATMAVSDRCVLRLLRSYEKEAKTQFYDFKPFLWGRSAAGHYSVRSNIRNALWRQPKTADVLNILLEHLVQKTIVNFPSHLNLFDTELEIACDNRDSVYDLSFLLPVFDQILAPESVIQTYRFSKSGALALTIVALSSDSEEVREAACHVLSRFYYHVEARRFGKDNVLWLRLVEAICRGATALEDSKLNSFAAIFFARASLVLTEPAHVMYVPICQYLGAKATPNLRSIPEVYTFLHSPDVNYKHHRAFILELIRDGLRSEKDFHVALHSMVFKLAMEFYDSHLSDVQTKKLVLQAFRNAFSTRTAVKLMCASHGFLSWLHGAVEALGGNASELLPVVLLVVDGLLGNWYGGSVGVLGFSLQHVLDVHLSGIVKDGDLVVLLRSVGVVMGLSDGFLDEGRLRRIISHTKCFKCVYLLEHGCRFWREGLEESELEKCVTQLTVKWVNKQTV